MRGRSNMEPKQVQDLWEEGGNFRSLLSHTVQFAVPIRRFSGTAKMVRASSSN